MKLFCAIVLLILAGCATTKTPEAVESNHVFFDEIAEPAVAKSLSDEDLIKMYAGMKKGNLPIVNPQGKVVLASYSPKALDPLRDEMSARGIPEAYWTETGALRWSADQAKLRAVAARAATVQAHEETEAARERARLSSIEAEEQREAANMAQYRNEARQFYGKPSVTPTYLEGYSAGRALGVVHRRQGDTKMMPISKRNDIAAVLAQKNRQDLASFREGFNDGYRVGWNLRP